MKPAPFRYVVARTLAQALGLKAEHGDEARFLAGGQSLVPTMNFRLAQPAVLIDINPISELAGVAAQDGVTRIGALTRYRALERDATIARDQPLLYEALPLIAHPQIRNRGTIGGNLAHADPASELPAVMLALGARLRAQSVRGERWIEAPAFFRGALTTALEPDEMLVEIALPMLPSGAACFTEVARRRGDFALIGVAAALAFAADGTCRHARLAYCGAGDTPVCAGEAASRLVGRRLDEDAIRDSAALARRELDPPGNMHASADYQRQLVGVLTGRALDTARQRWRAS